MAKVYPQMTMPASMGAENNNNKTNKDKKWISNAMFSLASVGRVNQTVLLSF